MDEILNEFLIETSEALDQVDRDLVALEESPENKDRLDNILRVVHSLKGTSGFLGLHQLESITHIGENLMTRLRDGSISLTEEITTTLLQLIDSVRSIVCSLEETRTEGSEDFSPLIEKLTLLQTTEPSPATPASTSEITSPTVTTNDIKLPEKERSENVPPLMESFSEQVKESTNQKPQMKDTTHTASVAESTIRVDVHLLDTLMNMVGELVLARNQILQHTIGSSNCDSNLLAAAQRLNLITSELQEGVMKTRMQPIGSLWSKLPRVVRDLSVSCNKKVKVEMEGRETELDKTLLEAIKDPLTHIVRNSIDHGLESPEERLQTGKPEVGTLYLRAYHESGQVTIEIADDGKGINPEVIREKAIDKGVITAEQAARMNTHAILNLIFTPGFSTAQKVTNISGRGVGMDVVRTNIERIGGSIDIQSNPGTGTTLRLRIPLTLAIIPGLIVTAANERFAIPQVNLLELVRLDKNDKNKHIEFIHNAPVYRLRGKLLPLVYLRDELQLDEPVTEEDSSDTIVNIVVLSAEDQQFGLVVDDIKDTQEIVVKPLSQSINDISVLAGATIMGDGQVALILDTTGIAKQAGILVDSKESHLIENEEDEIMSTSENKQTMLVFKIGDSQHMAIPLNQVSRLEEIPLSQIEESSGFEVVQYRDEIVPLLRIENFVNCRKSVSTDSSDNATELPVIIYSEHGRTFGLIVSDIVDIIDNSIGSNSIGNQDIVTGSVIINDSVTDILDIKTLIQRQFSLAH